MKQTGVKEKVHLQENCWIGLFSTPPAGERTVSCPLNGGDSAEGSSAGEHVGMRRCQDQGERVNHGKQVWQGQLCSNEQQQVRTGYPDREAG
jgi:hypothetical protein